MSIGLVDNSSFEAELERLLSSNGHSSSPSVIVKTREGRGNNIPDEIKKIAGEEFINGAPQAQVAEVLGITKTTVSHSAVGMNSTNHDVRQPKPEVLKHVNSVRDRITKRASRLAITALDSIDTDKVRELSPNKQAELAKTMTSIVKDMEPEYIDEKNKPNIQVVVYAPRERSLDEFEIVKALDE